MKVKINRIEALLGHRGDLWMQVVFKAGFTECSLCMYVQHVSFLHHGQVESVVEMKVTFVYILPIVLC